MRIWIDLANSPHVPFFRPLINEFNRRHHEVVVTARAFAETVELAQAAGLAAEVIGGHGGGKLSGKAGNLVQRALALGRWARGRDLDLALSHNSYSQILAARALSLRTITLMDYEHQPANHLAFRFASRIIVPEAFPEAALARFGATPAKVKRYAGLKEDVYLANFQSDPQFERQLRELGIDASDVLVVVRPPAVEALYHRFENDLFINNRTPDGHVCSKILLLPRNDHQRQPIRPGGLSGGGANPTCRRSVDGANLIAHSDLVVSAGGTTNAAAALGLRRRFTGRMVAIDEALVRQEDYAGLRRPQTFATCRYRRSRSRLPVARRTLPAR